MDFSGKEMDVLNTALGECCTAHRHDRFFTAIGVASGNQIRQGDYDMIDRNVGPVDRMVSKFLQLLAVPGIHKHAV